MAPSKRNRGPLQQWERINASSRTSPSLSHQMIAKMLPAELRPASAHIVRLRASYPSLKAIIEDHGLLWAMRALHGVFFFLARHHPRSLWWLLNDEAVSWLAPGHSLDWRDGLMENMRHNIVEIRREFKEHMEEFPAEMEALFFEGVGEGKHGPEAQAALENVWLESMQVDVWW